MNDDRVKRIELGWGAHFVGAPECYFRRNTLLELGTRRIIVSTVGNYHGTHEPIGSGRVYETIVFQALWTGRYWDADINRQASVNVIPTCLPIGSDDEDANQMHERVVEAFVAILEANDD